MQKDWMESCSVKPQVQMGKLISPLVAIPLRLGAICAPDLYKRATNRIRNGDVAFLVCWLSKL